MPGRQPQPLAPEELPKLDLEQQRELPRIIEEDSTELVKQVRRLQANARRKREKSLLMSRRRIEDAKKEN